MSKFFDVALSSWQPEANSVLHRVAPRHPLDRSWNYEDRFDFFTIVYDVFWSEDGTSILFICPPPLNLQQEIFNGQYREFPSERIVTPSVLTTGPIHIFSFAVSPGTQAIRLESPAGVYFLTPQPNLSRELENQRLIVTVSKNNELHWIRDWLYFHVKMHGCTGVIFYDNGSDRYTIYEVADAVKDVPGLETVVTVTTTSPYGVNNGPYGVNDSRYLTRGVLEHAKYRLARRASGLMHIDVDELVVSPERENVFEAVETSSTGYISFEGIWVERVTDDGEELSVEELSHSKFRYVAAGGGRSSLRKTAIAPNRVDDGVYMTTHRAYGARPDYTKGDRFKHRHFIGLKTVATNIKNKERLQQEPFRKFDAEFHEVDPVLAGQLEECFGGEDYKQFIRSLSTVDPDPDVLRRMGGVASGKGNYEAAIHLTEQAISKRPNYPSYHQFLARCLEQIGRREEAEEAQSKAKSLLSESPRSSGRRHKGFATKRQFRGRPGLRSAACFGIPGQCGCLPRARRGSCSHGPTRSGRGRLPEVRRVGRKQSPPTLALGIPTLSESRF